MIYFQNTWTLRKRMSTIKLTYNIHKQGSYLRSRCVKKGSSWGTILSRTRWRQLLRIHKFKWRWRSKYVWNVNDFNIWRVKGITGSQKHLWITRITIRQRWNAKFRFSIAGVYKVDWALAKNYPLKIYGKLYQSVKLYSPKNQNHKS